MLTIRRVEERIAKDFLENKIFSFYHSSAGQEAVAVGVALNMSDNDRMFGNHRSHGHYLAKGGSISGLFAEIYGKATGCCKGYGGSMHMLARDKGFMGTTPILGSIAPIGTGSAFQQKVAGTKDVTVVFVGDGATEEGAFYESVNLAATMKLPIVFVIEDNLYAVNSPESARRSPLFIRKFVYEGLGARYLMCDGNDFTNVFSQAGMLIKAARNGKPGVLYARCFRHMSHSGPLKDESVRTVDTEDVRKKNDPIELLRDSMLEASIGTVEDFELIDDRISAYADSILSQVPDLPVRRGTEIFEGVYHDA
jgi:pyruvate dehydrogenase E1 component alpha subunit